MMALIAGGLFVSVFALACVWAWRAGKSEARLKRRREDEHAALLAKDIRDHLASDDDYAVRVRARFMR